MTSVKYQGTILAIGSWVYEYSIETNQWIRRPERPPNGAPGRVILDVTDTFWNRVNVVDTNSMFICTFFIFFPGDGLATKNSTHFCRKLTKHIFHCITSWTLIDLGQSVLPVKSTRNIITWANFFVVSEFHTRPCFPTSSYGVDALFRCPSLLVAASCRSSFQIPEIKTFSLDPRSCRPFRGGIGKQPSIPRRYPRFQSLKSPRVKAGSFVQLLRSHHVFWRVRVAGSWLLFGAEIQLSWTNLVS